MLASTIHVYDLAHAIYCLLLYPHHWIWFDSSLMQKLSKKLKQSLLSTCSISSSQTARGTAEWHEGWRHTSPGDHRQDTSRCRAAANVREEHPKPIGQPGPRGHCSEPVTDLTADAGTALTNHLPRFTLSDWGQSLSPHRHVADVLPLFNHHVQHSQVSPPRSAPTTHLRTQKSISCAAGLWFKTTGTVDVGWEWMEESLLSVAD